MSPDEPKVIRKNGREKKCPQIDRKSTWYRGPIKKRKLNFSKLMSPEVAGKVIVIVIEKQ